MGFRDQPFSRKINIWSDGNALLMLIILNVFVFITLRFIMAVYGLSLLREDLFYKNVFQWFAMPTHFGTFITRPWTLLTSSFTQLDLWMMLSSIFWLWTFGFILQDLTGNSRIIPLYIYGSVAGAVSCLISFALVPALGTKYPGTFYFGCMPPTMSIAFAATVLAPGYRLFPMIRGGLPLWLLTGLFVVVDILFLISRPDWFFPHLAAALMGVFFIRALGRGNDWSLWMNNVWERLANSFSPKKEKKIRLRKKEEVFYNTRGTAPYQKTSNVTQQRVDEILDKINMKGYDRLTEEEKDLLRRASEEDL